MRQVHVIASLYKVSSCLASDSDIWHRRSVMFSSSLESFGDDDGNRMFLSVEIRITEG